MARVRNASPGARVLNVLRAGRRKGDEPTIEQVTLAPGEEVEDLELHDADQPPVQAMIDSGELVLDGAEPSEEDQEAADQKRYLNDPKYLLDQELAAEAGRRFADPLPEGTETEGEGSEGSSAKRSRGRPRKASSDE